MPSLALDIERLTEKRRVMPSAIPITESVLLRLSRHSGFRPSTQTRASVLEILIGSSGLRAIEHMVSRVRRHSPSPLCVRP